MATLSFVPKNVFEAKPEKSIRAAVVLVGEIEELETYAEVHNLSWITKTGLHKSGLTDRFLLHYGGYWADSVGNVFIPV